MAAFAYFVALVSLLAMERIAVLVREDRDGRVTKLVDGAKSPDSDLAPVRDQHLAHTVERILRGEDGWRAGPGRHGFRLPPTGLPDHDPPGPVSPPGSFVAFSPTRRASGGALSPRFDPGVRGPARFGLGRARPGSFSTPGAPQASLVDVRGSAGRLVFDARGARGPARFDARGAAGTTCRGQGTAVASFRARFNQLGRIRAPRRPDIATRYKSDAQKGPNAAAEVATCIIEIS